MSIAKLTTRDFLIRESIKTFFINSRGLRAIAYDIPPMFIELTSENTGDTIAFTRFEYNTMFHFWPYKPVNDDQLDGWRIVAYDDISKLPMSWDVY